ncbi:hypothetical protein XPR_3284 [Xanthomonas arboricola pv. pruni MAFF 301420]|uniref:Uncharacterized protein n=2 Tax=Xanthomonas arboricola pv. pruni TaxID=69929 RepID=W4SL13_9XANT|nr:hypothetical protein XPU_0797 [Xanthomonas arboricola pv. pruni str. MAFF 311562]GAE56649.1 hypothetical protein XPR_3284 [Xanthomonas arboricola pv. pruni MAFF 301420]GAE59695.1 hypothetical protein XPN_1601 [Xanthomonas arboricola pv. pruni MAFF 301427]
MGTRRTAPLATLVAVTVVPACAAATWPRKVALLDWAMAGVLASNEAARAQHNRLRAGRVETVR